MIEKKALNAADCASRKGKYSFGLVDTKAIQLLRGLADDLEAGRAVLHGISTSCHAVQDDFVVRELVVEMLEESGEREHDAPSPGPHIIKK